MAFVTSLNSSTSADTYRFFRPSNSKPVIVAMSGTEPIEIFRGNRKHKLINLLNKYPTATMVYVAPMGSDIPVIVAPSNNNPIYRGRGIMLEIAHGPRT